jgi:hypothetical protein
MKLLAKNICAVVAVLSLPLLLLTACSRATGSGPAPIGLGYCGLKPQVKPAEIMVTCNNDAITATKLTWSAWGKTTASAKGKALIDLCVYAYMDCAQGDYTSVPIVLFASRVKKCSKHAQAYASLRYAFPHGSPWGPAVKVPKQLIAPQDLPPANQTVGLTC